MKDNLIDKIEYDMSIILVKTNVGTYISLKKNSNFTISKIKKYIFS